MPRVEARQRRRDRGNNYEARQCRGKASKCRGEAKAALLLPQGENLPRDIHHCVNHRLSNNITENMPVAHCHYQTISRKYLSQKTLFSHSSVCFNNIQRYTNAQNTEQLI